MDAYDVDGACGAIASFLDALTNWYIRRSRDRIWAGDHDAFDTLYTVLVLLCRTAAPLLPLLTEEIYRGLTGERSVHLTDWPDASTLPADDELVASMDRVREVCSAASSVRKAANLRVRLPISTVTVAAPDASSLEPFKGLIADEVNAKSVELTDDVGAHGELVLQVVPAVLGPASGRCRAERHQGGAGRRLGPQRRRRGRRRRAHAGRGRVLAAARAQGRRDGAGRFPATTGSCCSTPSLTPELEAEGLARDVVRLVNQARKDAGLHVSDRVRLSLVVPDDVWSAVEAHRRVRRGRDARRPS